jgi:hypothetical protein
MTSALLISDDHSHHTLNNEPTNKQTKSKEAQKKIQINQVY